MLKNHLNVALRIFQREKGFTIINVLGLALGMWCTIMIALWIQDEYKYDRFHENGDHIYQVRAQHKTTDGEPTIWESTGYPIGQALIDHVPEVVNKVRYGHPEAVSVRIAEQLTEVKVAAGDPSYFQVFSFPLIRGTAEDCLTELRNVVISDELSAAYFGDKDPTGESFSLLTGGQEIEFTVSGVFQKMPRQSTMQFDVMLPLDNFLAFQAHPESWGNAWVFTYVLLDDEAHVSEVNDKIRDMPETLGGTDYFTLRLDKFQDRYLAGGMDQVIMFSIIAALTLLIACFNFINLTTARSGKRSREIGVKKVLGAGKGMLISQFLLESGLLVVGSLIFALILVHSTLPAFSQFVSKDISVNFSDPMFYSLLLCIGILTVIFSAIYPAVFLASFHAVSALKGRLSKNIGPAMLRKGLVIFQFSMAVFLMAGAMIVHKQLVYLQDKDLGLNKKNVVYVPLNVQTKKHYQVLKSELQKHSSIQSVSSSNSNFFGSNGRTSDVKWATRDPDKQHWMGIQAVDFGMAEMLDLQLVQGRFFSEKFSSDTLNYMVNEKAVETMGLANPIGEVLEFWGDKGGKIVGVVKDFHYESLYSSIAPVIIRCRPSETDWLYIKSQPGMTLEALNHLEAMHDQFSEFPLTYHFLDEALENGYEQEITTRKLSGALSSLAIFIACLGLLGLTAYSLQRRVKEVAIRKILGAGVISLLNLLSKEHFKLVAIGLAIGIPMAIYWSQLWLEDYAYRIETPWWLYALPGVMFTIITFITISRISLKTVNANPVDYLRDE